MSFIFVPRRAVFMVVLILTAVSLIGVVLMLALALHNPHENGSLFRWTAMVTITSFVGVFSVMSIATLLENELRRRDGRRSFLILNRGSQDSESYVWSQLFNAVYLGLAGWLASLFLR